MKSGSKCKRFLIGINEDWYDCYDCAEDRNADETDVADEHGFFSYPLQSVSISAIRVPILRTPKFCERFFWL